MSKAVIEIEIPNKCAGCMFYHQTSEANYDYNYDEELEYYGQICTHFCSLSDVVDLDSINTDEQKPENCPLISKGMTDNEKLNTVIGYLVELSGTNETINILKNLKFSDIDIKELDLEEEK